ncbi:MAG: hypothetical protein Q4B88_01360 [Moraxella sp.]|nr:hypothetical protein [Moraxella sp.]
MKNLSILALVLSATVAIAPAFAETTSYSTTSNADLSSGQTADLSFAFDNAENLQAVAMTDKEMAETEGAALPFLAATLWGGAGSAWLNHGVSYAFTDEPASVKSTLLAVGAGMVSRGYSNEMLKAVGQADKVTEAVIHGNAGAISLGTIGVYDINVNQTHLK